MYGSNAAIQNSELSYKLKDRKSEVWNSHRFGTYSLFFVVGELTRTGVSQLLKQSDWAQIQDFK